MASPLRAFHPARLRVVAALVPLLLQACAGGEAPPPCPEAVRIVDASRMVRYEGAGRDLTDVLFEAKLEELRLSCDTDGAVVEAALEVSISVMRGPADRARLAPIRYFVAIADSDRKVLARETFALEVPLEGNRTQVMVTDEVAPRIPLAAGKTGADYRIYVGFSLTPEELRRNRESN